MDKVGKNISSIKKGDKVTCRYVRGASAEYIVCEPFDFFKVHRKRLSILSTEPRSDIDMRRFYQEAFQLVLDGLINTKQMITHIYPLSQIQEAFELRNDKSDDKSIHVLIQCK